LDFDSYWLGECVKPEKLSNSKTKQVLNELAMFDVLYKDCLDRHNGLVKQIKERKEYVTSEPR